MHPHFEFQNGNFVQHFPAERQVVKTLFFLAKHLQKPLNDLGQTQRANFLSITRMDGKLGQGKRDNVKEDFGVITSKGIVGIIDNTSNNIMSNKKNTKIFKM